MELVTKFNMLGSTEMREFRNGFPDLSPEETRDFVLEPGTLDRLAATVKQYLQFLDHPKRLAEFLGTKQKLDKGENDVSVYTGQAGLALLYLKLEKHDKALDKIKFCLKGLKKKKVSFFCGDAGPLAIACVLSYRMGDRNHLQKHLKSLLDLSTYVRDLETDLCDELLYGRAGYLYSLLYVSAQTEDDIGQDIIPQKIIRKVIDSLLESGRSLSKFKKSRCPLLYEWHGKRYYGAAHGLAGIYTVLLQCKEYLTESELRDLLKPSIDYLLNKALPTGNYPSSEGNGSDKLVHWCHGCPGVVSMLLLAHAVWPEEERYLTAAKKSGDWIWKKGLLRKGYGLCHGTAGNGYGLLHLYQSTMDRLWLFRAAQFAQWCMDMENHKCRIADRPFSLMEGLAGTIYFLQDIQDPKRAKFPGFIL